MIKKLTIYFLLFNFINTVLFYNNEEGNNCLATTSVSADAGEINSLIEYLLEDFFNLHDNTPEDEDDDWSDPFKAPKTECHINEFHFIEQLELDKWSSKSNFPDYNSFIHSVCLDKSSPPPKSLLA